MKKLSLLGAVLAVMLVSLTFGNTSYAAGGTCAIGFTGPNSDNVCVSTNTFTCQVKNNNVIVLDNNNNQVATTGSATSGSSTSGGSSTTGSATNANGVTFKTTLTNGEACSVAATTPPITPVVTPPTVQVTTPQGAGGAGAVTPTALANTATTSPVMVIAELLGLVGAGVIASRLAVAAYGHFKA
jgi:hypothetical protein